MMERLLPLEVVCVSARNDDPFARLLPEEAAAFGPAVERRTREFTTARACARRALNRLGIPDMPILRGPRREPLWPAGVVGSITHCEGYRAAAVARQTDVLTIGIDAEPHKMLPHGVAAQVLLEPERNWLGGASREIHWDRLIFSAKESVFKAWFPLIGEWLDFKDAVITCNFEERRFEAHLLVVPPVIAGRALTGFHGRFLVCNGLILTSVSISQRYWSRGPEATVY